MNASTRTLAIAVVSLTVLAATSATVYADPTNFSLNSWTHAALEGGGDFTEDFTIDAYEWGTTDYIDFSPNNGIPDFFYIAVNSGPSMAMGFDYTISFDYSNYGLMDYLIHKPDPIPTHKLTLTNVKSPGDTTIITDVAATNIFGQSIGSVSSDGHSIFFEIAIADLFDMGMGNYLDIHFTQAVPTPGAMALLIVAAVNGRRRRRAA